MISSNIDNLCSKCYLKFIKIVADKMQSNRVSNANININSGVLDTKKNYSFSFNNVSMYSVKIAVTVVSCFLA